MALNLHSPIRLYGTKRKNFAFTVLFRHFVHNSDVSTAQELCILSIGNSTIRCSAASQLLLQVLLVTQEHDFDLG